MVFHGYNAMIISNTGDAFFPYSNSRSRPCVDIVTTIEKQEVRDLRKV